ncbi:hypothetical protein C0995_004972 [Termitomyces sp. Mi166|nr:hypothetical protein C0995_004972 [Termitomyces sp. Mi166\
MLHGGNLKDGHLSRAYRYVLTSHDWLPSQDTVTEVMAKHAQMNKGIHIGSWGQLQGGKFTKQQVIVSLIHRGNGTGPDADSGWEKAWRAAAWAQLGNATEFYHELSYAINRNFGLSLFSLYNLSDPDPIFQIDVNLAYPTALLNTLIQIPDVANYSTPLTVALLSVLPKQWPSRSIKGAHLRGGLAFDLEWKGGKLVSMSFKADANVVSWNVLVLYKEKTLASFETLNGLTRSITSF